MKENENEVIVPITAKEKFDNFWYYYKNSIILIVFFVVVLFSYFYSTIFKPDADATITIISGIYFYDDYEYISEVWSDYTKDVTGDGKSYIKIIPIQSDPNGDFGMDSTMYEAANMAVNSHIRSADNFLLMLDETNYYLLKEMEVEFENLSKYTSYLEYDDEMYALKGTNIAAELGYAVTDILYLALIDFTSLSHEQQNEEGKIQAYENDKYLLEKLITAK